MAERMRVTSFIGGVARPGAPAGARAPPLGSPHDSIREHGTVRLQVNRPGCERIDGPSTGHAETAALSVTIGATVTATIYTEDHQPALVFVRSLSQGDVLGITRDAAGNGRGPGVSAPAPRRVLVTRATSRDPVHLASPGLRH